MIRLVKTGAVTLLCIFSVLNAANSIAEIDYVEQSTLQIQGQETANTQPVSTYATPVSNLEYDPRVDLQSRNMGEAQADISIRGGIFENTGFRIGGITILDPQTGHYAAELPIAPEMLAKPEVLTGAENALKGFNSSVGTIAYGWAPIQTKGSVSIGVGDHGFNMQRIYLGSSTLLVNSPEWRLGIEADFSRSESDGTIAKGDHDYSRGSARVQLLGPNSQTDFFAGYQEKFFGWPNMYTPFGVNETENLKTRLYIVNHKQTYGRESSFELSSYYRRHGDHYVFSRENPASFQSFHETKVGAVAVSGLHALNQAFALNYAVQVTADSIESSSLENNFTTRTYYKASLLPQYRMLLDNNQQLILRGGVAFDKSNRDDSELSFIGDIIWQSLNPNGSSEKIYLSYAETSQLPGYTAIGGSESAGLFRSNYSLTHETSRNLEFGAKWQKRAWSLGGALFYRWDDNLTDWTYSFSNTAARSASAVDIDTYGIELIGTNRWDQMEWVASYAFLKKSEDYGAVNVDASFYALNYPNHRLTLGAIWYPSDSLEFRVDNEWRKQEDNRLRGSDDQAMFTHMSLTFTPPQFQALEFTLAIDNLWDESFEEVPGVPGRGDQYSLGVSYYW